MNKLKFVLNGCNISFIAEAPRDITLEQLIKQIDRVIPDWGACGICALEDTGLAIETPVELIIDYDNIKKANDDVGCTIKE